VATVDITSLLSERLDALRDAQLARAASAAAAVVEAVDETPAPGPVVVGEATVTVDPDDDTGAAS